MTEAFSEKGFLDFLLPQIPTSEKVVVPSGDDCAVIECNGRYLAIGIDQLIEGRHYLPETAPELAGRKLLTRNLSDLAAMGATPLYALLSCAINPSKGHEWLARFHKGLLDCASEYKLILIGGDLAGQKYDTTMSLTIIGDLPDKGVLRSTARIGDRLFATGHFGNSFLSNHHLLFSPRIEEGKWLREFGVKAMMDVTDGLVQDVSTIAKMSNLQVKIDLTQIPLRGGADLKMALTEGEDYELIFAVDPADVIRLKNDWPFACEITELGLFEPFVNGTRVADSQGGDLMTNYGQGFDHFSS
jgi:thiamine-monophosphate kinase